MQHATVLFFSPLAGVLTYVSDIICPASYHLAWRFNYRDKCVCLAICPNRVCLQEPPVTYTNTVSRTHTGAQQHLPHLVLPLRCQAVLWSACSFNRTDLHPQTVREPIHPIAYTPTGACSKVWEDEHHDYAVHCKTWNFFIGMFEDLLSYLTFVPFSLIIPSVPLLLYLPQS